MPHHESQLSYDSAFSAFLCCFSFIPLNDNRSRSYLKLCMWCSCFAIICRPQLVSLFLLAWAQTDVQPARFRGSKPLRGSWHDGDCGSSLCIACMPQYLTATVRWSTFTDLQKEVRGCSHLLLHTESLSLVATVQLKTSNVLLVDSVHRSNG